MTSFKIFLKKNSNSVFLKGKFEDYTEYSDLQKKIIKQSLTSSFKANKDVIKKSDLYVLEFGDKKKILISLMNYLKAYLMKNRSVFLKIN